ncbi:MAG: cob(I)yrinic acid a,c-diamide adenosyltransferase [Hyphomonadaceae bacterium]|nr:cob(I)yrinic acid a,c-diamide adenosyltransferase [Hyphomonadaceae bacterium]
MVRLDKIYTRAGDGGRTRLATGEEVAKWDLRVEAYGGVDETNAALGVARLHAGEEPDLDAVLARIQNELFDLGADLATPERDKPLPFEALRIQASQVAALENDIDRLNADLAPLTSFILPAGRPLCAHLHVARTLCRRAERIIAHLSNVPEERVSPDALRYANRLSDFLFVAARWSNRADGDVLWRPGASR